MNSFSEAVEILCEYYERTKAPRDKSKEIWFERIRQIPTEALPSMIQEIESQEETFPKNIPNMFWRTYHAWLEKNPEKKAQHTSFDCPDCTDGLLFARIIKCGTRYTYLFRCDRCKQNKITAYPQADRATLSLTYNVIPKTGDSEPAPRYLWRESSYGHNQHVVA